MAKNKNPRFTTPKGELKFPNLQKPDRYDESSSWQYKADIVFDSQEAVQDIVDKIDEVQDNKLAEAKKNNPKSKSKIKKADPPYEQEVDENGEETGRFVLKARQNAYIEGDDGETINLKPALFDAKGKPIKKRLNTGTGTVARLNIELAPSYVAGQKSVFVKLRLKAAQIVKYQPVGGGNDPKAFGFAAEDDEEAFDSSEVEEAEEPETSDEEEGDGDEGEDDDEGEEEGDDADDGDEEEANF
jgi:hypothetical protein